jgi:hypothetical protein
MQSETIKFVYILHASNVNVPVQVEATLNGTVIDTAIITSNGKFEFVVQMELKSRDAKITLSLGQLSGSSITVNSIKLTWTKDNSSLDPLWFTKPAEHEIWNYNEPGIDKIIAEAKADPKANTILLDYTTDGRRSFLTNYAVVETNGDQFNLQNKPWPYTFKAPGSFTLPMSSPVSYWLMERLFVVI